MHDELVRCTHGHHLNFKSVFVTGALLQPFAFHSPPSLIKKEIYIFMYQVVVVGLVAIE